MATCRECLHYEACLDYCTEKVLSNRGVCEHYTPKSDYVKRERAEWVSVEDRLPEKDTRVLVYLDIKDLNPYSTPFFDTDRILDGKWVRWNSYVTHWQPLPEPPKGD